MTVTYSEVMKTRFTPSCLKSSYNLSLNVLKIKEYNVILDEKEGYLREGALGGRASVREVHRARGKNLLLGREEFEAFRVRRELCVDIKRPLHHT